MSGAKGDSRTGGAIGWLLTAGVVAAWDLLADETMSSAFERGLTKKRTGLLVIGAWGVLTAHLFGVLPRGVDPFGRVFDRLRGDRLGAG